LALYAVASAVYRVAIVVLVLLVLDKMARPYHLESLVLLVAAVTLVGMAWPAVEGVARFARDPARRRIVPLRAAATCAVLGAALAAILLVPLPRRVAAPVMLEYRDAQRVYVSEPGRLVQFVPIGEQVKQGEVVARLENSAVQLELARLASDRDRQQRYLKNLEAQRLEGTIDGAQIPAAAAALADAEGRLAQFRKDAARLTITAPADGTVLPPPAAPQEKRETGTLPRWSGTPLEQRNLGSFLETGTLLCLVGDPERFEAILHVDEDDVELVGAGQEVTIALDHRPGETFRGKIVEVARLDLDVMPRHLAAAGDLPARTDERGVARPLDTWYQARVELEGDPPHMLARVHGRAKISVAPQTLAARLGRYLKQTFAR
jgi:putative peptide zinc metalloprotease protein